MICRNQQNLPDKLTGKQHHHMAVFKHKIHSFKHTSSNWMEQSVRIRSITYCFQCQVPFSYKKSDAIKGALLDIQFLHPYTVHLTRSLQNNILLWWDGRWSDHVNLMSTAGGYSTCTEFRLVANHSPKLECKLFSWRNVGIFHNEICVRCQRMFWVWYFYYNLNN